MFREAAGEFVDSRPFGVVEAPFWCSKSLLLSLDVWYKLLRSRVFSPALLLLPNAVVVARESSLRTLKATRKKLPR